MRWVIRFSWNVGTALTGGSHEQPHIFTMLNSVALQQPNWDIAVDPYK
jgi:hypothetical protein